MGVHAPLNKLALRVRPPATRAIKSPPPANAPFPPGIPPRPPEALAFWSWLASLFQASWEFMLRLTHGAGNQRDRRRLFGNCRSVRSPLQYGAYFCFFSPSLSLYAPQIDGKPSFEQCGMPRCSPSICSLPADRCTVRLDLLGLLVSAATEPEVATSQFDRHATGSSFIPRNYGKTTLYSQGRASASCSL